LDRARWESEVTQEVNTLSDRVTEINNCVDPSTQTLSQPAAHIAKFMIEHCPDGLMRDWLKVSDINAELPDLRESDICEGLGDLECCGIIRAHRTTGPTEYKLTQLGYQQLDPQFMSWSPQNDARRLAQLTLIQTGGVSADELQNSVGWPPRRFNPAWEELLTYIVEGHVSRPSHLGGGAMRFHPSDADRSGLRRFVAAD
jgi:hypothetical protein